MSRGKPVKRPNKVIHQDREERRATASDNGKKKTAAGEAGDNIFTRIMANMMAAVVLLILLSSAMKNNVGYKWMWNTLIKGNMKTIQERSDMSDLDKNLHRHGNLFKYLDEVNKKTPETAIILMPADSVIDKINPKLKLGNLKSRTVVNFFIYPRKAAYPGNEWDKNLIRKATHVAIINGSGYEMITNPPAKRAAFAILPIH